MSQTRRNFLRLGIRTGLATGAAVAGGSRTDSIDEALAVAPPKRATLQDIEHIVILMQENRSFDHYFGTLRGVRGFADPHAPTTAGRSVFDQLDPDLVNNPQGYVLPFRLDTFTTSGQGVADQSHAWAAQQGSWAEGTNAGFVTAHRVGNGNGAETGGLYLRANTIIPTAKGAEPGPALAARPRSDVRRDRLPRVSWILAGTEQCEHPNATPGVGAGFVSSVLSALTSNPKVWAKTLLLLTYDENDGFFDHVVPPTAPSGTPGEYVDQAIATKYFSQTLGFAGPVGLGFRVPMILISPFTRGGLLCSDTFDHTSMIRLIEERFGVGEPNISAWRRDAVGDLTSAIGVVSRPSFRVKNLPNARLLAAQAEREVAELPAPTIPQHQSMPGQEPGSREPVGPETMASERARRHTREASSV